MTSSFLTVGAMALWVMLPPVTPPTTTPSTVNLAQKIGTGGNEDATIVRDGKRGIVDCYDDETVLTEYYCPVNAGTAGACRSSDGGSQLRQDASAFYDLQESRSSHADQTTSSPTAQYADCAFSTFGPVVGELNEMSSINDPAVLHDVRLRLAGVACIAKNLLNIIS